MSKPNSYFKRLTLQEDTPLPHFIKCFAVNPVTKQALVAHGSTLSVYSVETNKILIIRDHRILLKDDLRSMEITALESLATCNLWVALINGDSFVLLDSRLRASNLVQPGAGLFRRILALQKSR